MIEINRDQCVNALVESMYGRVSPADTRADIGVQQTDEESSEIQEVVANIRHRGGDIKHIEDGAISAIVNNKVALFAITDYLDETDFVENYEVMLMETKLNGVVVDVSDDVDIEDVRDMNNFFFKIAIYMNPDLVMFDPVYVDIDDIIDRNDYTLDIDSSVSSYVFENMKHVNEYVTWTGDQKETYLLHEAEDGKSKLHVLPPTVKCADEYTDIIKYNLDATTDNVKKMFVDLGYTVTNIGKNGQIDYEMDGEAVNVLVYDIESLSNSDVNIGEEENLHIVEMVNTITESTLYSDNLHEIRRKVKIDFKGKKRIKMQCAKGFKYDPARRVCVKISGSEIMTMKRSHVKASRTKKAAGSGFKLRTVRKMKKANRFRKMMGIKPVQM